MPKREYQPTPLSERHAAFEASLRDGGYGHDIYSWPFYANRDILAIYGVRHGADVPVDWLDRDSFVDRYVKACKATLGVNLSPDCGHHWVCYRNADNKLHW